MQLVLYTRKGCCLCDRLEEMLRPHLGPLMDRIERRDLDREPEYRPLYDDRIPVLTCDGEVVLEGRPTEDEVSRAIATMRVRV